MELIQETEAEKRQGPLPEPELRHTAVLPVEKTEHGQAWLRLLAAILVGLVLVILIVLLARWIYHSTHHAAQTAINTTKQQAAKTSQKVTNGESQTTDNTSSSSSSSGSSTTTTTNGGKITNTGPGNVLAVFVGSSLAAAGLHFIISVRRQARQN